MTVKQKLQIKSPILKSGISLALLTLSTFNLLPEAQAGYKLQVNYRVVAEDAEDGFDLSETFLADSEEEVQGRADFEALAKSAAIKNEYLKICKATNGFNSRVKITTSNGSTAGLGNLKSVSVPAIKVIAESADLPDYSEEERAVLDEEYLFEDEFPDYIEDGYIYFYLEAYCQFSGTIAITNSNAYTIYIDGGRGPEYSKAELAKMKWKVTLVDSD